jgi:CheY-like chemotaxis protein
MLAYSGQGHFAVRPLGLAALIEENRPHYEAALPPRVRLVLEAAPGLPLVMADAAQVHQLVLSLVINAGEAIGERPGTVTIRGGSRRLRGERAEEFLWRHTGRPLAPGPYVSLEVQDDGAGMEAGTVSRIFDPFFTTKFVGRGLGLAAVLGTVRGHGGGIGVESAPGRGTCITVLLPEARPPEGRADEGPATILVADQEEALREVVRDVLEASGFLVVARADARAAAELFEEDPRRYALVLLGLPARGSTETLERFRRADASVPVLLTSGFARPAEADHDGTRLGFLPQPFTASELLAAVRSHLPARRPA